ncbi:MAG: hypothetical protein NVS4B3_19050 [Gemmatimonadaceae bacterium]
MHTHPARLSGSNVATTAWRIGGRALATFIVVLSAHQLLAQEKTTTTSAGEIESNASINNKRFAVFAPKLVTALGIGAGQTVVLRGGTSMIPLMEDFAIATGRVGAHTLILLNTDRLARFYATELPDQYLGRAPNPITANIIKSSDFLIDFPQVSDVASTFGAMPADRAAKAAGGQAAMASLRAQSHGRYVALAVPQPGSGSTTTFAAESRQAWDAIDVDYARLAKLGTAVKHALEHARKVRVTSPEGTDVTFAINDRPVVTDVGAFTADGSAPSDQRQIALPGGRATVAPIEASVNGRLRAAKDVCGPANNLIVKNEAIDLRNGNVENVRADTEQPCVQKAMAEAKFGALSIGLNPAIQVGDGAGLSYYQTAGTGIVSFIFGNNVGIGGTNAQSASPWTVSLLKATVEADGRVIVRDGKLVLPTE